MYGLEAISAANGWAMAVYGVMIVMTGLAVLATIISLFPKAVALIEKKREQRHQKKAPKGADASEPKEPRHNLDDIDQIASLYDPVVKQLGEAFELRDLYAACIEKNFPHPYLTIRALRESGVLVPRDDGGYGWSR